MDDPEPVLEGHERRPDPGRPRPGQVLDPDHAAPEQGGRRWREQRRSSVHQVFPGVPGEVRSLRRRPPSAIRHPADRLPTDPRSVHEHRETRTCRGGRPLPGAAEFTLPCVAWAVKRARAASRAPRVGRAARPEASDDVAAVSHRGRVRGSHARRGALAPSARPQGARPAPDEGSRQALRPGGQPPSQLPADEDGRERDRACAAGVCECRVSLVRDRRAQPAASRGPNTFELWTDAEAMDAWALAVEHGRPSGGSAVSFDAGATWSGDRIGHLKMGPGEYVVRLRLDEGSDPEATAVHGRLRPRRRLRCAPGAAAGRCAGSRRDARPGAGAGDVDRHGVAISQRSRGDPVRTMGSADLSVVGQDGAGPLRPGRPS